MWRLKLCKRRFAAAPGQNTPESGHVATYAAAPGQNTPQSGHVAAYAGVEHAEDPVAQVSPTWADLSCITTTSSNSNQLHVLSKPKMSFPGRPQPNAADAVEVIDAADAVEVIDAADAVEVIDAAESEH